IATVFAEGRALIEQTGDRPALAKLLALYGAVRLMDVGSPADYLRYSEEALTIVAGCDDPALRAVIAGMAEPLDAVREGIERGRAGGTPYQEAHAWLTLARILLATDGELSRAEIE